MSLLYCTERTMADFATLAAAASGLICSSNPMVNHWWSPYFLAISAFFGVAGMAGVNDVACNPSRSSPEISLKPPSMIFLVEFSSSFTSRDPGTISPAAPPTSFSARVSCWRGAFSWKSFVHAARAMAVAMRAVMVRFMSYSVFIFIVAFLTPFPLTSTVISPGAVPLCTRTVN